MAETVSKRATLELAGFLDSEPARALTPEARAAARRVALAFLSVCFEEVGKSPHLLDGEDVREALVERLPAHLGARDPDATHVPAVLAALYDHLERTRVVAQAFEIRRALDASTPELLEVVRAGTLAHRAARKEDPFVHRADKLGRNDPCSCGSGKKYKKCHGKNA